MLAVYVSGAVQNPGVYTLPVGSRVAEAVSVAGGAADGANLDGINLAAHISDAEHVLVPRVGDTPVPTPSRATRTAVARASSTPHRPATPATSGVPPSETPSKPNAGEPPTGRININTATAAELEPLPGIGTALASRIVAYREANGLFQTPEDIMRVPGIKEGLFAKIRDYITVGP
jgi:competence protein ComEA